MFGNNEIKIDFDILNNTISTYQNEINNLKNAKNSIKLALDTLSSSWKGQARDQYFNETYLEWDKGIDEHLSRLGFLCNQLKSVKRNYEEINKIGGKLNTKL